MNNTFRGASGGLNAVDLSSWVTGQVTDWFWCWRQAGGFDGSFLKNLLFTSATNMTGIVQQTGITDDNYDDWLISLGNQRVTTGLQNDVAFTSTPAKFSAGLPYQATLDLVEFNNWSVGNEGQRTATVFIIKTDNAGTSNNDQFTLPGKLGDIRNCIVDWGDTPASVDNIIDPLAPENTHTYAAGAGTYTITIFGDLRGFTFNNGGDIQKVTEITTLGLLRNVDGVDLVGARFLWRD